MYYKKVTLYALLFFVIELTGLKAQEAIPASGGDASGSGGSVSYTVGQLVYTTNFGASGSVAQGVQQPYEISIVVGIEAACGINLSVLAYPNPTTDLLLLKVDASTTLSIQSLSYQLFDMNGKLVHSKKIESSETSIAMSNLVPAIYFLKVLQSKKEIKTFKIIKN
jgi:hypothetical protein